MSAIPPNLVGPILQTPFAQGQASAVRDGEEVQKASADRRQTAAITETDSTVETTDNDTQVHTDAEGSGSRGRAFSPQDESSDDLDGQSDDPTDPEGQHIDVEA